MSLFEDAVASTASTMNAAGMDANQVTGGASRRDGYRCAPPILRARLSRERLEADLDRF